MNNKEMCLDPDAVYNIYNVPAASTMAASSSSSTPAPAEAASSNSRPPQPVDADQPASQSSSLGTSDDEGDNIWAKLGRRGGGAAVAKVKAAAKATSKTKASKAAGPAATSKPPGGKPSKQSPASSQSASAPSLKRSRDKAESDQAAKPPSSSPSFKKGRTSADDLTGKDVQFLDSINEQLDLLKVFDPADADFQVFMTSRAQQLQNRFVEAQGQSRRLMPN